MLVGESIWRRLSLQQVTRIQLQWYTIINLDKLHEHLQVISQHATTCQLCAVNAVSGKEAIVLVGEQNCQGLCSTLTSRCIGCNKEFQFSTSSKVQGMSGGCYWECNLLSSTGKVYQYCYWFAKWCMSSPCSHLPPHCSHSCLLNKELDGSSQGINETSWGGRDGHGYVSPKDISTKVYQPLLWLWMEAGVNGLTNTSTMPNLV